MCYNVYMKTAGTTESVGVRELRQNLSVYLERVAAGTLFCVTDRGRAVAMLVPLPENASTVDRLVASGRAAAATSDIVALGHPTARLRLPLSKALQTIREDRL